MRDCGSSSSSLTAFAFDLQKDGDELLDLGFALRGQRPGALLSQSDAHLSLQRVRGMLIADCDADEGDWVAALRVAAQLGAHAGQLLQQARHCGPAILVVGVIGVRRQRP